MDIIVKLEKVQDAVVRYRIRTDAGFLWTVHSGTYKKLNLQEGQGIDPEQLEAQIQKLELAAAQESVVRSLAQCGRSQKGLQELLLRKHFSESIAAQVVSWASAQGWIDESSQLAVMVESRLKKYGPARVRMELIQKGYPATLVDQALRDYEPSEPDWMVAYRQALTKKEIFQKKDPVQWKLRMKAWLYQKGHGETVIRNAIQALENGDETPTIK